MFSFAFPPRVAFSRRIMQLRDSVASFPPLGEFYLVINDKQGRQLVRLSLKQRHYLDYRDCQKRHRNSE